MFQRSFPSFILVAIFIGSRVSGNDIIEIKRNAVEKVEAVMRDLKRLTNETLTALPTREGDLKVLGEHGRSTGDGIFQSTKFDIHRIAVSGAMARTLLRGSQEMANCLENEEKESYRNADRYYTVKFLNPFQQTKTEAEEVQGQEIRSWIEGEENVSAESCRQKRVGRNVTRRERRAFLPSSPPAFRFT